MFGWIKKTYITALLCYYTRSIQTYAGWVEQQVNYTRGRHFGWMKRLCAINPPVGQPDHLTCLVDEAVVLVFDLHFGIIHSPFAPAFWHFSWKRFLRLFPLVPIWLIHLTCWISQILYIHFTCIEYLWSVESENHIGPKKSIGAVNRLFHRTLQLKNWLQFA